MIYALLLVCGGLVLLIGGAHILVQGSSTIARRFRISPLIIGLTVVAFGTSSPELLVSLDAASIGESQLALGNVVGSNIANIALILGLTACIAPLRIQTKLVKIDLPIMIGCSLLLVFMIMDGAISRLNGTLLLLILCLYLGGSYFTARRDHAASSLSADETNIENKSWLFAISQTIGGLVLLALGAHFMVTGAVELAEELLIPTSFVALTIVAIGTSLPELATSLIAAFEQKADMAIGNVLGSNIFNILGILGFSALIFPLQFDHLDWTSLALMLTLTILLLPLMRTGFTLSRREGVLLLLSYIAYIAYLFFTLPSL